MTGYKLYLNIGNMLEDLRDPVDTTVVDILTDRAKGCRLSTIRDPRTDSEQEWRDQGRFHYERLAINYGPAGNKMYFVFLNSPEVIKSGQGKVHVLDNTLDDKRFLVLPENAAGVWSESSKVGDSYTLEGDIEEVFEELRQAGFVFSDEIADWEFQFRDRRNEDIARIMKVHGIFHSHYNPELIR